MNQTAVSGERVVIVEVHDGQVKLRTGRIAGEALRLGGASKKNEAVVRGDRQFYPIEDIPELAYEKAFDVNDIHLLKEQEARALQDPEAALDWFGGIYQDWMVVKIRRALKRLQPKAPESRIAG